MYRRYYSVNDMPQLVNKDYQKPKDKPCNEIHTIKQKDNGILSKLENDDIILIAIALLLLADDCDDKLLIIAIAFIFISGII